MAHGSLLPYRSLWFGITFVHQELNLSTISMLARCADREGAAVRGSPQARRPRYDEAKYVAPLLKRLDVDFKVDDLVSDLSLAQRQLFEIAKAPVPRCSGRSSWIEPTSA